jgi:cellulose synthase/poly-beta-1,6-N-acetylglucosamine synthase-like glycosyltransferase
MEFLTGIYLFYIVTTMYVSLLGLIIYFKIKDEFFDSPGEDFIEGLTVIIPAYNEEGTIGATIEAVLDNGYPKNRLEVMVVNDGSTDSTAEVVKKYNGVILFDKPNSGKADSVNKAIAKAKNEFIAIIDADSYPDKDALKEVMKYFADEKVGAVTGVALVKNRNTLLEKCQAMEYVLIAWTRKGLDAVESVFVTPGSLSVYRKKALKDIGGGFDKTVMTEDIEIAWNLLRHKWKTRMATRARVFTIAPTKFKAWYNQRIRWNVGGFQTLAKHWDALGKKDYNMFGIFVIPFFMSHLFISFTGFFVFAWVLLDKLYNWILFSKYSLEQNSTILELSDIYLLPSVFTFFAVLVIILFGLSIYHSLKTLKEAKIKMDFAFVFYSLFYLAAFPILLIISLYLWKRGYSKW